jgi:hypothetical protein
MATASSRRDWDRTNTPDGSVRWESADALVTVARSDRGWTAEVYEGRLPDGSLGSIVSESAETRAGVMPAVRRWVP